MSVLVVEDHPTFSAEPRRALLLRPRSRHSRRGRRGQRRARTARGPPPPDVIICDVDMPGRGRRVHPPGRRAGPRQARWSSRVAWTGSPAATRSQTVCEGYGLQVLGTVEKPLTTRRLSELLGAYRRAAASRAHPAARRRRRRSPRARAGGRIVADFQPIVDLDERASARQQVVARWRDGRARAASRTRSGGARARGLTARSVDRMREALPSAPSSDELDTAGLDMEAVDRDRPRRAHRRALGRPARRGRARERRRPAAHRARGSSARGRAAARRAGCAHATARRGSGCASTAPAARRRASSSSGFPLTARAGSTERSSPGLQADPARVAGLQEAIEIAARQGAATSSAPAARRRRTSSCCCRSVAARAGRLHRRADGRRRARRLGAQLEQPPLAGERRSERPPAHLAALAARAPLLADARGARRRLFVRRLAPGRRGV